MRLAKINADEYSSVKGGFQVQGFPTLLFFNNGQQIKYGGQRTKDVMISWLSKKTRPAVTVLEADKLDQLSNDKVNVLLHTNDAAEHDQAFIELANTDDYNSTCLFIQVISLLRVPASPQAPFRSSDLLAKLRAPQFLNP